MIFVVNCCFEVCDFQMHSIDFLTDCMIFVVNCCFCCGGDKTSPSQKKKKKFAKLFRSFRKPDYWQVVCFCCGGDKTSPSQEKKKKICFSMFLPAVLLGWFAVVVGHKMSPSHQKKKKKCFRWKPEGFPATFGVGTQDVPTRKKKIMDQLEVYL
jgi:hypothetical protein